MMWDRRVDDTPSVEQLSAVHAMSCAQVRNSDAFRATSSASTMHESACLSVQPRAQCESAKWRTGLILVSSARHLTYAMHARCAPLPPDAGAC